MAAAAKTLPFQPSSAATVVRTLSHAFSPRHPLRRGRHLLHQPLASCPVAPRGLRRALSLCTSAASGGSNGALGEGGREYDYDLLTIGAGSGGMRASRAASSLYGARVAVCEMPFATVASDALGGTYVSGRPSISTLNSGLLSSRILFGLDAFVRHALCSICVCFAVISLGTKEMDARLKQSPNMSTLLFICFSAQSDREMSIQPIIMNANLFECLVPSASELISSELLTRKLCC
jgi:hypothetical protein